MEIKPLLICFFVLIVLPSLSSAMVISIQVQDVLNGRSSYLQFNKTNFVELGLDWENTGSLDCNTRLETEITDTEGKVHRIWSQNVALAPGDSAFLQAYYLPQQSGKYSANVILHYCDRIIPLKSFGFEFTLSELPELNLSVSTKSSENTIEFAIEPQDGLEYIKIIPLETPKTWIFEPVIAENLSAGEKVSLLMKYEPVVWMPKNTTFAIVSDKGIREVNVELKKADDVDWLGMAIISIFMISIALNLVFYSRLKSGKSQVKKNGSGNGLSDEELDKLADEENEEMEELKTEKPQKKAAARRKKEIKIKTLPKKKNKETKTRTLPKKKNKA
jgi:hypothetical protein